MLKLIYGEKPDLPGLILIHAGAVLTAVFAVLIALNNGGISGIVPLIVLIYIALDLGGGVVANITRSTNDYYAARSARLSVIFLLVHFEQPLLLTLALGLPISTAVFLYVYALVSGLIVVHERIKHPAVQKPLAGFLLMTGLLIYWAGFLPSAALSWFGVLYLTKLILMFAVDHFAEGREVSVA